MPRSDEYDDFDDRPSRGDAPFPVGVKTAGIIWIAFGILGLIGNTVSFVVSLGRAGQGGGGPAGGGGCGVGCGVLFALVFLLVGIQTVKGTAKGTLGNGIGSLVFGLLYTVGAIALIVMSTTGKLPPPMDTVMLVTGGFLGLLAVALLTAGVLALAGKTAYEEWRAAQGRGPRRRRETAEEEGRRDRPRRAQRDRDDDDDNDRPRRPRRDRDEDGE